ncbi:MAG: 2-phosphosulfolactate phosphatase, partial [Synergistaceae bacterium]|nr:2-phosphosulfolactate phosphatase [Synergistaceae bacterium]
TLCAGLLLEILKDICGDNLAMADCARLAFELWQNHKHEFLDSVMTAEHAKLLDGLGFGRDIKFACQVGVSDAVPVLYYNENLDSIYLIN